MLFPKSVSQPVGRPRKIRRRRARSTAAGGGKQGETLTEDCGHDGHAGTFWLDIRALDAQALQWREPDGFRGDGRHDGRWLIGTIRFLLVGIGDLRDTFAMLKSP